MAPDLDAQTLESFITTVRTRGRELYRDLPWRRTRDPYGVLVSEVMLQQTQVKRVLRYWEHWMELFPTVDALSSASKQDVLDVWQGLGYMRRCLALKRTADILSEGGGRVPQSHEELLALPGIGPATAAGVRVFAFGIPDMYLETNVRAVFLHELFSDREGVSDKELIPLIEATVDKDDPGAWYYALLDYGAHLKKTVPNPSRKSKHHSTQSGFEGSRRQKRARLLRAVLAAGTIDLQGLLTIVNKAEREDGRDNVTRQEVENILADMVTEGFLSLDDEGYHPAA